MISYNKEALNKLVEKKMEKFYKQLKEVNEERNLSWNRSRGFSDQLAAEDAAFNKMEKTLQSEEFIDRVVDRIKRKQL